MGLLINFESIDRGGKSTQAPLVAAEMEARGLRVEMLNFPNTRPRARDEHPAHDSTGVLIERYLAGDLPMMDLRDSIFRIPEVDALPDETKELVCANIVEKLVQVLFSVNRRESRDTLVAALEANDLVIVGRYLSAHTYGVAGGVSRLQLAALEGDLPSPDLTFLFDVDPEVARLRRSEGVYDVYEEDAELQAKVRRLYNELVREDAEEAEDLGRAPRFLRIDGDQDREAITRIVVDELVRRIQVGG